LRTFTQTQWEFYDLQRDPYELTSVYGNPEYAEDQARMEQELQRQRRELEVPEENPPQSFLGGPDRYQKAVERVHDRLKQLEAE
jgi:arylsulfatase A-like enzyme